MNLSPFNLSKLDQVKRQAAPWEARYNEARLADGVVLRGRYLNNGPGSQWGYGREGQGKASTKVGNPPTPNNTVIHITGSGKRLKASRSDFGMPEQVAVVKGHKR